MGWAKMEARSYTVVYDSEGPVLYETGESRERRGVKQVTMTEKQ